MASCRMPEELYPISEHYLSPDQPVGPRGGRPPVPNGTVRWVPWYVVAVGCRLRDVPAAMGCYRETAVAHPADGEFRGVRYRPHLNLLRLLHRDGELKHGTQVVDLVIVRNQGERDLTGPSPVDRGKPGTKYSLVVAGSGVPLGVRVFGANASDHPQALPSVLEGHPWTGGRPDRPREIYADAGHDGDGTRNLLRRLGVEPHVRRRGMPQGSGLGKTRWVVERTASRVKGLRRLWACYDSRGGVIDTWATLATAVIDYRFWQHDLRP